VREKRREGRKGAAGPPTGQCGKGEKRGWADFLGLGQNGRKEIFFKNKTFSKSIFSIFNSKPNSNKI